MTARDFVRPLDAEDGHAASGAASLLAGAGVIALGIGAAGDWGWLALAGGIGGGLALTAYALAHHAMVDYSIFARLGALEGASPAATEEQTSVTTDA